MVKPVPRAIRNHNPLNIEHNPDNHWLGLAQKQDDGRFCVFRADIFGYRAALILLKRYIDRYGLDTPAKIIRRWAPPVDNDTPAYIRKVEVISRLGRTDHINFSDRDAVCRLIHAMACVESGQHRDIADVYKAYDLYA